MPDYQYAYLLGTLLLLAPIWAVLYFRRRDTRREMLVVSILGAAAGPLSQIAFLRDYWRPETVGPYLLGMEDVLFGFVIAGIAAVVYEEITGRRLRRRPGASHWPRLAMMLLGAFLLATGGTLFLGWNSIYATMAGLAAVAVLIVVRRHDLFVDALASGMSMAGIMFVAYSVFLAVFPLAIQRWWLLDNVSGVLVEGIPVEELVWAFCLGLVLGPVYEFVTARRLARRR